MQSASGTGPMVVQVSPKNNGATSAIVHQNGQHIIVGKIAAVNNRPTTSSADLTPLQSAHSTNSQTVYPAHYIETIAEQTVYSANGDNGPVQYQGYTPILYAPVSGGQTYYQTATGQVLASTFAGSATAVGAAGATTLGASGHAQLVNHQGTTYLLQGNQLDEDASTISHTAKASPITVQWLVENYETAEGVSLPRSTLYFHYLQHCNENKLEPMNPASFGKLIRSVFFGLRTRRLGTRGNSKYHYYGIRIKPTSSLNHFVEDAGFSLRHYPNYNRQSMEAVAEWKSLTSHATRLKSTGFGSLNPLHSHSTHTGLGSALHMASQQHTHSEFSTASVRSEKSSSFLSSGGLGHMDVAGSDPSAGAPNTHSSPTIGTIGAGSHQHAQFLGEASSALPNLDEICRSAGLPVPGETDLSASPTTNAADSNTSSGKAKGKLGAMDPSFCSDVITFCRLYAMSASFMLDAVVNLDFTAIETVWKAFWRTEEVRDSRLKQSLSQERLYELVSDPAVLHFVRLYDHTFYQSLAEVLIPNVLRPIPHTLTQAIRNFAKSLEGWMRQATQGLDSTLVDLKISAVSALAQTLRRYTSLNHLAQAARTVLKNANQINQMLTDLNRVDFNNVQEQASWVCQCSDATVSQLEQDFKRILQKHASLEEWAQWLDTVVTNILQPLEGNSLTYTRAAHQLILKWSFYSSMVIRDLTLRSAASFGSFHLIRLLYDEYIFYLVEHKVAAHLGMTPVAVMGEMGRHLTQQHYAQSRPYSDPLLARRDGKPVCSTSDFTSYNTNPDGELALHPDSYLSEPQHQQKATEGSGRTDDDDEEVDEYLDDEDEAEDSTGDESAMLKHAHASVQAYCRSSNATSSTTTTASAHFDEIGAGQQTVFEGPNTTTSMEDTLCTPSTGDDQSAQTMAEPESVQAIKSTEPAEVSELPESSCSPPPILTNPNPPRKVVRVTTFCDPQPSTENTSVPLDSGIGHLNPFSSSSAGNQSSPTKDDSTDNITNPNKRIRLV